MIQKNIRLNFIIAISIILALIIGAALPSALASNGGFYSGGFTKGVSWQPIVSMKKTTFVNFDDESLIDDYAYLDGHEYTITQTVFGKILIKAGAYIKHHAYVRIGTTIGENSVIEPFSQAQREIPANEVWGGTPAKFKRKL